jgi:uncharacterized membrane protein YdfJ with MMPL/SSD domain
MQSKPHIAGRIGRWSAHHRKTAITGWIVFVILAFMAGGAIGTDQLDTQEAGVRDSGKASQIIHDEFAKADDELVLISDQQLQASSPQFHAAVDDVVARLKATGGVDRIQSPYAGAGRISDDGHAAMVGFRIKGDYQQPAIKKILDRTMDATAAAQKANPDVRVEQFGQGSAEEAFNEIFAADLSKAGAISLPITLIVLVFAFGALVLAGIPLLLAMTSVFATLGLVGPLSQIAPVDESISHVILLIGLAVGVDYSLFYLRRAREEKAAGATNEEAIDAAAATSGHSILVSGLTVMVSMAGMYLAGAPTFVSFATGTIVVVATSMLASLTVLPALMSAMGDRIHKPGRIPGVQMLKRGVARLRIWSRIVEAVHRRPAITGGMALAVLVALAIPALSLNIGSPPMAESLPQDEAIVQTFNRVQKAFPAEGTGATVVIKADDVRSGSVRDGIAALEQRTAQDPRLFGGNDVDVEINEAGTVAAVQIGIAGDGASRASNEAIDALRGSIVPQTVGEIPGAQTYVGGITAEDRDFNDTLTSHLPYVIAFVMLAAFALLLVTFRSIVIPIKAIVLNLLSVAAAYGAMVLVFQHGWFKSVLGFEQTGPIVAWIPLFLFVVLFGLSMDYHVFILSRVREAYDKGMRTQDAVTHAVKNTAGVVTSAAVVMVAVFAIFGSLSFIAFKQMGVGLAVAVLIDATLIRGVLLPASMHILGERNWWLPRFLGWLPRRGREPEIAPARS